MSSESKRPCSSMLLTAVLAARAVLGVPVTDRCEACQGDALRLLAWSRAQVRPRPHDLRQRGRVFRMCRASDTLQGLSGRFGVVLNVF